MRQRQRGDADHQHRQPAAKFTVQLNMRGLRNGCAAVAVCTMKRSSSRRQRLDHDLDDENSRSPRSSIISAVTRCVERENQTPSTSTAAPFTSLGHEGPDTEKGEGEDQRQRPAPAQRMSVIAASVSPRSGRTPTPPSPRPCFYAREHLQRGSRRHHEHAEHNDLRHTPSRRTAWSDGGNDDISRGQRAKTVSKEASAA